MSDYNDQCFVTGERQTFERLAMTRLRTIDDRLLAILLVFTSDIGSCTVNIACIKVYSSNADLMSRQMHANASLSCATFLPNLLICRHGTGTHIGIASHQVRDVLTRLFTD